MLSRLYLEFFRALANQTRFSIVQLLRDRPHHVGEMADKLGYEQSRVSHNLACLLNCGFVLWEWSGKKKIYRLNPELIPILAGIDKHLNCYAPALESCAVLDAESKPVAVIVRNSQPAGRISRARRALGAKK